MIAIVTYALFAPASLPCGISTATHIEVGKVSLATNHIRRIVVVAAHSCSKMVDMNDPPGIASAGDFPQFCLAQFPAGWGCNLLPLFSRKIESGLFHDGEELFLGRITPYDLLQITSKPRFQKRLC